MRDLSEEIGVTDAGVWANLRAHESATVAPPALETTAFDPAEYLDDDEALAGYLSEALETSDPAFIADALGVVARAKVKVTNPLETAGDANARTRASAKKASHPEHPAAMPGQASLPAHESAIRHAPAENPCTAGSDGAISPAHSGASAASPRRKKSRPQDGGELVHLGDGSNAHQSPDQFANPLVAEIVELWRQRQIMVEAQRKLTLQAHAICRRFTAGDKTEAQKLYAAITKGKEHHLSDAAAVAVSAIMAAQEPLVAQRNAFERTLAKLGKQLPIAHMAERIRGVSHGTLATIVGELGDLSAYEKGIAGIWKRAGLAVIDGERQRMKSGAAALIHGYSPMRRSVFWNIGGALMKAQSTGEGDMPYRAIYDARKAHELARGIPKAHAHNRASRHMTKALLRDLWREWRRVSAES